MIASVIIALIIFIMDQVVDRLMHFIYSFVVSSPQLVEKSMAENKKGWYVLRAISGKEAQVKEIIEGSMKRTDLGNYVFQVLIPTEKVMTLRNGKKVIKEKNLYSGYVFIEADLTGEVIHELTNTTNVIDFLRGREKNSSPSVFAKRR